MCIFRLSANTLGQRLSEDLQKYWDKRDTYDLLILLDWNSNAENVCSSKIEILRSIIVDVSLFISDLQRLFWYFVFITK